MGEVIKWKSNSEGTEMELVKVTKTHDIQIGIKHDVIVDLIASHLYAIGVIPRKSTVVDIDLGLELDVNNLVPMDVTLGIPPEEDE